MRRPRPRVLVALVIAVVVALVALGGGLVWALRPAPLPPHLGGAFVAPAPHCSNYVSTTGNGAISGTSYASPTTFSHVRSVVKPGSVVCLLPGTYLQNTSGFDLGVPGTPGNWITYTSYDPKNQAVVSYLSGQHSLIYIDPTGQYLQFINLIFDGIDLATNGIFCSGCRHIRILDSTFHNMHEAGVATYQDGGGQQPDYITVDHSVFYHNGNYSTCYTGQQGSSAISLDDHTWADTARGFHSFVTNNIIGGSVDGCTNSDGNGIIIDTGGPQDATPPILIANNVGEMDGGRCIENNQTGDDWIINNTCFSDALDLRLNTGAIGNNGEIVSCGSSDVHYVNNIAYAWNQGRAYSDEACGFSGYGAGQFSHNMMFGGYSPLTAVLPAGTLSDNTKIVSADPKFVNPPALNATADGQYANALDTRTLTTQFQLQSTSPALAAGIDPTTLITDATEKAQAAAVLASDVLGHPRYPGQSDDLGAYQTLPLTLTVTYNGATFTPASAIVKPGCVVTFSNTDSAAHTISADDASWTTGSIAAGGTTTHTFSTVATYRYRDATTTINRGRIIVRATALP